MPRAHGSCRRPRGYAAGDLPAGVPGLVSSHGSGPIRSLRAPHRPEHLHRPPAPPREAARVVRRSRAGAACAAGGRHGHPRGAPGGPAAPRRPAAACAARSGAAVLLRGAVARGDRRGARCDGSRGQPAAAPRAPVPEAGLRPRSARVNLDRDLRDALRPLAGDPVADAARVLAALPPGGPLPPQYPWRYPWRHPWLPWTLLGLGLALGAGAYAVLSRLGAPAAIAASVDPKPTEAPKAGDPKSGEPKSGEPVTKVDKAPGPGNVSPGMEND